MGIIVGLLMRCEKGILHVSQKLHGDIRALQLMAGFLWRLSLQNADWMNQVLELDLGIHQSYPFLAAWRAQRTAGLVLVLRGERDVNIIRRMQRNLVEVHSSAVSQPPKSYVLWSRKWLGSRQCLLIGYTRYILSFFEIYARHFTASEVAFFQLVFTDLMHSDI